MPRYIIERELPGVGSFSQEQLQQVANKSCSVLDELGPKIQWVSSFVTTDKIYCEYLAPNEEMVRQHAAKGGFPANRISEVKALLTPESALKHELV